MSNSPRNGSQSTKTASVDDRHVDTPWGSSIVEITSRPQNRELVQETGQNHPKLRVLTMNTYALLGIRQPWKSLWDTQTIINSPRNGSESPKTASVDDRHNDASRGSSIVEITPGPQNSE